MVTVLRIFLTHVINLYTISLLINSRFSKKVTNVILGLFFTILSLINIINFSTEDNHSFLIGFLIASIICTVVIIILSKDKFSIKCFYFITYTNVFMILQIISTGICEWLIGRDNFEIFYEGIVILRSLFFIPLLAWFRLIGRKKLLKNVEEESKNWRLLALTALAMLIMVLIIAKQSNYLADYSISIYLFIGIIIEFLVYCIVFINISLASKSKEMGRIKTKNDLLNSQIESLIKHEDKMIELRHDFRHHNMYVIECAKNKDTKSIINYLEEYNSNIEKINTSRICQNEAINMVLVAYKSKALNNNIGFTCQVKISDILIKDTDLISVFGNILENAYNHCLTMINDNPVIEIYVKEIGNKLSIICNNSCNDDVIIENGMIVPPGIGIKSVINTISKYYGEINYSKNDKLCLTILMSNNSL